MTVGDLGIIGFLIEGGFLVALAVMVYRNTREVNVITTPEQPEDNTEPVPVQTPVNTADWQVTEAPMVEGVTLREWLINASGREGIWADIVVEFYTQAANVPEVFSYFKKTVERGGMEELQKHFLRALMIVTGHGLKASTIEYLVSKHSGVRDEQGRPIDPPIYDMVISTLESILIHYGVPRTAIDQLGQTIAPLRDALTRR